MSTTNLPGGKGRSARKVENLTAIYEPIVWKMCSRLFLITESVKMFIAVFGETFENLH
jgi:hypothetical protein